MRIEDEQKLYGDGLVFQLIYPVLGTESVVECRAVFSTEAFMCAVVKMID